MSRSEIVKKYYDSTVNMLMLMGKSKDLIASKHQITGAEVRVLYLISSSKEITTSQIAKQMCLSDSAITQAIDNLVDKRFIQRAHSKEDRRKTYLSLSKTGAKKFDSFKKEHLKAIELLLSKLSENDLEKLIELQTKISANI